MIFHLGGALDERSVDDGAVGNRDAITSRGSRGRGFREPRSEPHDGDRLQAAYGAFARLQEVKRAYDPDNAFRVNRNIWPAR